MHEDSAPASAAPAQIIQTKIGGITICLGGPGLGLGPAKIISSINIADNEDNDRDDRNWPEPEEERRTARVIRHFLALGR